MANLLEKRAAGTRHRDDGGPSDGRQDIHNSELPVLCVSCEARHRGICGALAPDELVELSRHTSKKVYPADAELSAADEPVRSYANILRGVVKLSRLTADGRQQIVGLQFAPDFLGRPFRASTGVTAEAATDIEVCTFPKEAIEAMIARSPKLEHRMHEQALKELDEAREWIFTLGRKSAAEKVASFIHLIAANADPLQAAGEGPVEVELPLKRADIADFLGLTIETVSRQITKLRKAGIIVIANNRTVRVPDMARLEAACETDR